MCPGADARAKEAAGFFSHTMSRAHLLRKKPGGFFCSPTLLGSRTPQGVHISRVAFTDLVAIFRFEALRTHPIRVTLHIDL
jgi:hypothetical protein